MWRGRLPRQDSEPERAAERGPPSPERGVRGKPGAGSPRSAWDRFAQRGTAAARCAHASRAGSAAPGQRRPTRSADRQAAVHGHRDGEGARGAHPHQARSGRPDRCGRAERPAWASCRRSRTAPHPPIGICRPVSEMRQHGGTRRRNLQHPVSCNRHRRLHIRTRLGRNSRQCTVDIRSWGLGPRPADGPWSPASRRRRRRRAQPTFGSAAA